MSEDQEETEQEQAQRTAEEAVSHLLHAFESNELIAFLDEDGQIILGHHVGAYSVVGEEVTSVEPIMIVITSDDHLRSLAKIEGIEVPQSAVDADLDAFLQHVLDQGEGEPD